MGLGADPDDDDENPDVWQLFRHYDALYFRGVLIEAGFSVEWSHPRTKTTSTFGSCSFGESNTITLYEPILKYRTNADLKNALLHLMIHAFLSVKHDAKGIWCHGPAFRDWMDALNTCSIEDRLRPTCGYCITTTHDFSPEKCGSIQGFLWKCESCGVTLLRAKKLGPPSDSCCIENVSQDATCGNMLCNWHNHKLDCDGTYVVTRSPETPGQQMVPKGRQGFLTEMSKMLKSQGAAEESDSDEVQENFTVAELIAESKLVSQVGGRNRSPGSSFSKEASKSNMPLGSWNNAKSSRSDTSRKAGKWQQLEHAQKSSVQPSATQKKVKLEQDLGVPEKYGVFSLGSCNNAKPSGSSMSRKTEKWIKREGVEKSSVPLATPLKKLKLEHDLVHKHGGTKPLGNSTGNKEGRLHKPEGIQKASVIPAAPPRKRKQDLVASEKNDIYSFVGRSNANVLDNISSKNAHKQGDLATPLKKLKLGHDLVDQHGGTKPLGGSTGNKVGKLHKPEGIQKATVLPAAPPRKLKLDLVASEKNDISSFVGRSNADVLDNISSKNAHKQGDLATPLKKQKLEHDLVDQHGGTKPLGGSTGNKVGKLHKPEGIQKTSVLPAAPPRRLKQDLVASEKKDFSSFVGRSNANVLDNISSKKPHKQREHEDTWKPIARPPAPQSILKQQSKTNSSTKAGKQQIPECFQKTFIQPAASQSKPKRSNHVAPGRPKTRSKTSNPARKKEYACVSVWANIYESECSSGSAEPLVNKRTERRKRARERSVQIRRSRKRSASGISPIKAQPAAAEDEISSQQGKPPPQSQCLQFILIDSAVTQDPRDQSQPQAPSMGIAVPPADKVKTQTPRGHSQLPAQCMDIDIPPADLVTTQTHGGPSIRSTCIGIATVPPADHVMTRAPVHQSRPPAPCSITTDLVVPPHSADPPSLTPLNPSSSPDVIDISDDD